MRSRRLVGGAVTLAIAAAVAQPWSATAASIPTGGCEADTQGGDKTCTYTAPHMGDVIGKGRWLVEIKRGTTSVVWKGEVDTLIWYVGGVSPGDVVKVTALDGYVFVVDRPPPV